MYPSPSSAGESTGGNVQLGGARSRAMAEVEPVEDGQGERVPATAPFRLGHRPELDGLRGIAVVLVVVYHLDTVWPELGDALLPAGYLGVDLFLVLSGFLVTTLLLGERQAAGRIDLWAFLRRRGLRLVPALVALLGVMTLVAAADRRLVGRSIYDTGEMLSAGGWVLTFTGNWAIVRGGGLGEVGHLWTIALEGQFYLLWALALVLLRRRMALVVPVALGGVVAVAAWRWYGFASRPDDVFAHYVSTLTRLDAPLVGAMAGAAVTRRWTGALREGVAGAGLLAGLAVVTLTATVAQPFEPGLFRGGFTAIALAGAVAVVGAVEGAGHPSTRWLAARPLTAVGRGSYSLYLWHVPVFLLIGREAGAYAPAVRCLAGLALAALLAHLSYRFVERPFLARKARRSPASPGGSPAPMPPGG